jgi:hypothetical protein
MKRKKLFVMSLLASAALFMSMSSNYENPDGKSGHNGSPGEQTCAKSGCHATYALNSGTGSVSISFPDMPGNAYVAGQTYTVQVTVAQSGIGLFGFGAEALLASGANGGTLNAGAGSQALNATVSGNSRKTITQMQDAGLSANTHTWSFTWVAPATGQDVTFYAVGNAADGDGGTDGDRIYSTSQVVTPASVLVTPTIQYTGDLVICQGESVSMSVATQPGATFTWHDANNTVVGNGTVFSAANAGCYSVTAVGGAQSLTSTSVCVTLENPNAAFSGLSTLYCSNEGAVALQPTTTGGTFSGTGVSGSQFNPSAAGVGIHDITYSVTSSGGCVSSTTQTVTVVEVFSAEFTTLAATYCSNATVVVLTPVNAGGQFSGPITGGSFDPSIGAGTYDISYTIGQQQCATTSTQTVVVNDAPDATFNGLPANLCVTSPDAQLVAVEASGVFNGTGVSGELFSPAASGAGNFTVTYAVTNGSGCLSTSSQSVTVAESANSAFSGLTPTFCANNDAVQLVAVAPGGTFTGDGISGTMFNPATAGVGVHDITYSVDLGNCSSQTTISTEVLLLPDASFSGLGLEYCENADIVSDLVCVNTPAVFSGPGVAGSTFDAGSAGAGVHTITCAYTDANGCTATSTQSVTVHALPLAGITVSTDLMTASAAQSGANYQWWNCDNQVQVDGATSQDFTITDVSQNGNYSVAVTLNGCDVASECVLLLIESVEEIEITWSAGFYPNPASTDLNVWSSRPTAVSIYNSLGAMVSSQRVAGTQQKLDVSALPVGIYEVVMQSGETKRSNVLMIQR